MDGMGDSTMNLDPKSIRSFETDHLRLLVHKINNTPKGQGNVRVINWDDYKKFWEIRPSTPFESNFLRLNSRIGTG